MINQEAFDRCNCIEKMVIPSGVTTIGDRAFCNCSELTKIFIPKTVTSIGDYVFAHNWTIFDERFHENSITVYFEGTEEEWNNITKGSMIFGGLGGGYAYETNSWDYLEEYDNHTVLFNKTPEDMNS